MKKIIPFLLLVFLIVSCKTGDKFSIHKRKYNQGVYLEKNHPVENLHTASKQKNYFLPSTTIPAPQIRNTGVIALAENRPSRLTKKHISRSPTQGEILTIHLISQKNEVKNPSQNSIKTIETKNKKTNATKNSQRHFGDILKAILIFFAILIVVLGLVLIGAGIYFLIAAATMVSAPAGAAQLGLSLLGYGCIIIGTSGSLFYLMR
jgi:Ca2+/Na+ antiporter